MLSPRLGQRVYYGIHYNESNPQDFKTPIADKTSEIYQIPEEYQYCMDSEGDYNNY